MTEPLKGKCNKCGAEYDAAHIGVIHKCGRCEGGRVVVEGRDDVFLNVRAGNILSTLNTGNLPVVNYLIVKRTRRSQPLGQDDNSQIEKDIISWLERKCNSSETTLDKFTLKYVIRTISNRRYHNTD
jgi:DNA-directed RNA polymerase subunit RPC12/RpoP